MPAFTFDNLFPGLRIRRIAGQSDARASSVTSTDGPVSTAILDFPSSCSMSLDGNTLFFTEYYQGKVRAVTNVKDPPNSHVVTLVTGLTEPQVVKVGPVSGLPYVSTGFGDGLQGRHMDVYNPDGTFNHHLFDLDGAHAMGEFCFTPDESFLYFNCSLDPAGWNLGRIGRWSSGGGLVQEWVNMHVYVGSGFFGANEEFWGTAGLCIGPDDHVYYNHSKFGSDVWRISQTSPYTDFASGLFYCGGEEGEDPNGLTTMTAGPTSTLIVACASDGGGSNLVMYDPVSTRTYGAMQFTEPVAPQKMCGANSRLYVPSAPLQTTQGAASNNFGGLDEGGVSTHAIYELVLTGSWLGALPTTSSNDGIAG